MSLFPANSRRSHRRAAALLIVLAALVLTTAGLAALARAASTVALSRKTANASEIGDDLLRAAEAPILFWLERHSARAVVPPEALIPEVPVLSDVLRLEPAAANPKPAVRLRITAYDQLGMVPVYAAADSPLRATLPEWAQEVARRIEPRPGAKAGLDSVPRGSLPVGAAVFPVPARALQPLAFGPPESTPDPEGTPQRDGRVYLGARVATHPSPSTMPAARGRPPATRINVNTAPLPLVAEALRLSGRGGLEAIGEARGAGRPFNPGSSPPAGDGLRTVVPVGTSDCWAFRVDAGAGRVERSWWCVYQRTVQGWRCVQRLVIDE